MVFRTVFPERVVSCVKVIFLLRQFLISLTAAFPARVLLPLFFLANSSGSIICPKLVPCPSKTPLKLDLPVPFTPAIITYVFIVITSLTFINSIEKTFLIVYNYIIINDYKTIRQFINFLL